MTDEELKARYPRMSAKTRQSYLKIVETHKEILVLQMLIDALTMDRLLGKPGFKHADRSRARWKKEKLIEIIRDRLGRKAKQN